MNETADIFVIEVLDDGSFNRQGAIKQFGSSKSFVEFYSAADGHVFQEDWIRNDDLQNASKWRLYFNERDWNIDHIQGLKLPQNLKDKMLSNTNERGMPAWFTSASEWLNETEAV